MRSRMMCAAAFGGLALAASCAFAGLGSGGRPPDGIVTNGVAYARRGALGADDYVVTNLWTGMPSYALAPDGGTNLLDRAVNRRALSADTVFALPPVPATRSYDAHRSARAFVLVAEVAAEPPPEVSFSGLSRIYTTDGGIRIGKGVTWLSFLEIGEGEFVVESRELTELN